MGFGKNLQFLRHLKGNMTQEDLAEKKSFKNPFVTIPNAYKTLKEYMRVNGLERTNKDVIPCFETDGESMDIYIACK